MIQALSPLRTLLPCLLALALSACGGDRSGEAPAPAASAAAAPATVPTAPLNRGMQIGSAPLLKTQTADYTAMLPCADCQGIQVSLSLRRNQIGDNSFLLRRQHLPANGAAAINSGNWIMQAIEIDGQPRAVVTLNPDNAGQSVQLRIDSSDAMTVIKAPGFGLDAQTHPVFRRTRGDLDLRAVYDKVIEDNGGG